MQNSAVVAYWNKTDMEIDMPTPLADLGFCEWAKQGKLPFLPLSSFLFRPFPYFLPSSAFHFLTCSFPLCPLFPSHYYFVPRI